MKRAIILPAVLLLLNFSAPARADEEASAAYKEFGATLGTPAVGNLVAGYWNTEGFPWVLRFSGMYYGVVRGVQADLGWGFDHEGSFKQYVSVALATAYLGNTNVDGVTHTLYGAGPVYGFNWLGFSFQAGFVIGTWSSYHPSNGVTTYGSPVQLVGQLGYTFLWH